MKNKSKTVQRRRDAKACNEQLKDWRNGREVDGGRLENGCRRESTVGSNPTSSAKV
jgi:hypothetical protein